MKRPGRPRKHTDVELPTSKMCNVCNAVFRKSKNESHAAWHDRVVCSIRCVHRSNRGPRGIFDHERFIAVWNGSSSAQEAAQQLGISRETASSRARELRKSGRAVKFMRTAKTTRSRNVAGIMMEHPRGRGDARCDAAPSCVPDAERRAVGCGADLYRHRTRARIVTALYWPDFDCTPESRSIAHADTVHDHHATERAACEAFLAWMPISVSEHISGRRCRCIRGPGGLVRGVRR